MPVTDPYKISPQSKASISGSGTGISSARPQGVNLLGKSLGFASAILKKIEEGDGKRDAANVNLGSTKMDNDLSNEFYRITNKPTDDEKRNLPEVWKDFTDKKVLQYMKMFGGDPRLKDTYSKTLAAALYSKLARYNPQVQLLWNQFASEYNKEQSGKLFQGITNDTHKNPENVERNIYKKLSIIEGKRIGNPDEAHTSRWEKLDFLQAQKSIDDLRAKESDSTGIGSMRVYKKQKFFVDEINKRQTIENYLVQKKHQEEAVSSEVNAFIKGSFFSGNQSLMNETKNLIESQITEFYSEADGSASMQSLLESGAGWRLRVEKESVRIKNETMEFMEKFGSYFNPSQRQKILDNVDKSKEKFIKIKEEKIKNYIIRYKARKRAIYEQSLNHYQSGRVFDSGDDYKDKIDAADDVITHQNSQATNAAKVLLDKDTEGDPIGMGMEGETRDNGRLKRQDMADTIQQIGIGKILFDPSTNKAGLTEDTYSKLERGGISRERAEEIINTPYLNQAGLKRFLQNNPQDEMLNKKLSNALQIVQREDGSVVAYHKNFAQALLLNKKYKHLYGVYVKDKMSFGRATTNVKQEQNFQGLLRGAKSDPTNMRVLYYRAKKAFALGRINFNQLQQIEREAANNAFPNLSLDVRTVVKPGIEALDEIIKAHAGKSLMPMEQWLDQLSMPQLKLRRKINDYIKMMSQIYQKQEDALIKSGTSVREKVDDLINRLKDEAERGSVNLRYDSRDNYYKIPVHRFKNIGQTTGSGEADYSQMTNERLIKEAQRVKGGKDVLAIMKIRTELKKRGFDKVEK